jgi:hypothetical protein
MSNLRQPDGGTAITGPLTLIGSDGGYTKAIDSFGAVVAPQQPLVQYAKPPGVSAAVPSNPMVQQLCTMLAPLAAAALMKNSVMLSRICLMPQQVPASGLGYSSLAATYTYTFGSTTVSVAPSTRYTYSETLPVDLTISSPTLVADLANRMGAQLGNVADAALANLSLTAFTTNAAQGTAATELTETVMAAAIALLPNTGEPIFLAVHPAQLGLAITSASVLPSNLAPLAPSMWSGQLGTGTTGLGETLANGASPTANLQGVWVIPCAGIRVSGGAPGTGTEHNVMFTPSAYAACFEVETNINNTNTTPIANCSATGSFGNCTVTVWALNSASGSQAIYCSMVFGFAVGINANGVQVKS